MDTETREFFERFEQRINNQFVRIEERFDTLENNMHDQFVKIDHRFDHIETRLNTLERNQDDIIKNIAFLIETFGSFRDKTNVTLDAHAYRLRNLEAQQSLLTQGI